MAAAHTIVAEAEVSASGRSLRSSVRWQWADLNLQHLRQLQLASV